MTRRGPVKRWAEAEDDLLRQLYPNKTNKELCLLLPGRTKTAITLRAALFGLVKTDAHRSETHRRILLARLEAKGGQICQDPRPVGATHRKGRYTLIKVAQPDVWKPLHIYTWEQANGPVPEGMIVAAKDGNVQNTNLANLCLRTRAEHQLRNNHHYKGLPEEIVDILHLQNELKKEIKRKTRNEK
ncbi:HNH endonuclease signature motif containing protein [Pseudomonas monteilii]|uniref:HNH endonuclease signature motif containing protein n=1 Tax=Pseudomonas monteilii TaxID=76759 RepID=UPI001E54F096|nr:HNH endonuclease signature motif containing protein [Pseudomonas monteilii]MCE1008740.1 HNH endonuclease [Pseudomonas monteilii]